MDGKTMDPIAAERLKRLQMEDLGTARREFISTSDSKKFKNVCLEDLEASRRSNETGSEAQKVAEANRARLSSWANVYKELGDTQDLEHLDNILDGQSHRAQLSALIHNHGGQSYTKTLNKRDNFLKVAENDHGRGRGHAPNRRSLHVGRGGGVMGTRGRQVTPFPSSAAARTSNQGAVAKLGRHTVETTPGRSRLDPALECNNDPYQKSREENARIKFQDKTGTKMPERTTVRTRRPIVGDYARILSPPESFLAIARSMVNTRNSDGTVVPTSQSPDNKSENSPKKAQKVTKEDHVVPAKAADTPPRQSTEKPVVSRPPSRTIPAPRATKEDRVQPGKAINTPPRRPIEKPVTSLPPQGPRAAPTPKASAHRPAAPNTNASAVPTSAANKPTKDSKDRGSKPQGLSIPRATNEQATTADSQVTENFTKPLPSPKDLSTPNTESEPVSEALLLDLGSTPPERSPLEDRDYMNSPAIQDLRGIDFRSCTDAIAPQEAEITPDLADSEQPICNPEDVTLLSNNATALANYQRELALLSAILESTTIAALGDEYCQKLKDCKEELEAKIKEARQGPPGVSSPNTENHHQDAASQLPETSAPAELPNNKSEPTATEDKSKTALNEAKTPPENTPAKQDKKPDASSLEDSASSLRLKQAVLAPVFYPRSSSFNGYRSPRNSISSDSTSPPPTPVPTRTAAILIRAPPAAAASPVPTETTSSHIFGDHLLPGRRSRVASSLRSISSTSGTSADESSASKVSIVIPKQRSVLSIVEPPAFESPDSTKSSTQPKASDDVPFPLKTEPISHGGSPSGPSADKGATRESSKSQSTPQVTSDVQKTGGPNPSSLGQPVHAAKPPTQPRASSDATLLQKTETATRASSTALPKSASPTVIRKEVQGPESKASSLGQSIHASPVHISMKQQPTTKNHKTVQKVDSNLGPSKRSTYASSPKSQQKGFSADLSGILSSRYAMPENHKPVH